MNDLVYGSFITLMVGGREEIKVEVTNRYPAFDGDMDFLGRCIEIPDGPGRDHDVIVMLPDWPLQGVPSHRDIALLAHELFHATAFVMEEHGVPYSADSEEAWAYYFDHLVRRALEVLR